MSPGATKNSPTPSTSIEPHVLYRDDRHSRGDALVQRLLEASLRRLRPLLGRIAGERGTKDEDLAVVDDEWRGASREAAPPRTAQVRQGTALTGRRSASSKQM